MFADLHRAEPALKKGTRRLRTLWYEAAAHSLVRGGFASFGTRRLRIPWYETDCLRRAKIFVARHDGFGTSPAHCVDEARLAVRAVRRGRIRRQLGVLPDGGHGVHRCNHGHWRLQRQHIIDLFHNRSTSQATCTANYSDSLGNTSTATGSSHYASVADFVDEVSVIPPIWRSAHTSGSGPGTTHFYDGQRRLIRIEAPTFTTVYTTWDESGLANARPRRGKLVSAPAGTQSVAGATGSSSFTQFTTTATERICR